MKSTKLKAPAVCPVCGEEVPSGAVACPECGADHKSGWRKDADAYEAVDLPDEDFNYGKFVREEFGSALKPAGTKTLWWIAAIVLIVVLVMIYFYAAH
jgi:uncharacterized membrane protein YvbJ